MAKSSPSQRKTAGRAMHEFKHGELKSGPGGRGGKVKSRRQAIAIARVRSVEIRKQEAEQAKPRQEQAQRGERRDRPAGARRQVACRRSRASGIEPRHGRQECDTKDGAGAQGCAQPLAQRRPDQGATLQARQGPRHRGPFQDVEAPTAKRAGLVDSSLTKTVSWPDWPAIHDFDRGTFLKSWMPGARPGMTGVG